MGIKVGGIDLAKAIIDLEYGLGRTQRILQWIVDNNVSIKAPDDKKVKEFENEAIEDLQKKYPDLGIKKKK